MVYENPTYQLIFGNLPPYLRKKKVLSYPVIIRIRRIEDFSPRLPSTFGGSSPPSSDGDSGHDGNPNRGYGEGRCHTPI